VRAVALGNIGPGRARAQSPENPVQHPPVIPSKANRRAPLPYDKALYKERNLVERFFNKLKQFRRVATRYDKLLANYRGFVLIAAIAIMLR
jgi:putative transposase